MSAWVFLAAGAGVCTAVLGAWLAVVLVALPYCDTEGAVWHEDGERGGAR